MGVLRSQIQESSGRPDDSAALTPEMMTRHKSLGSGNWPAGRKTPRKFGIIILRRIWPEVSWSMGQCHLDRRGDEGAKNKRKALK